LVWERNWCGLVVPAAGSWRRLVGRRCWRPPAAAPAAPRRSRPPRRTRGRCASSSGTPNKPFGQWLSTYFESFPAKSGIRLTVVQPGVPPAHASISLDAPANASWEPNLTNWNDIQTEVEKALTPLWRGEVSAKDAATNAKRAFETLLPQGELVPNG
jgi:hypothetical protein